MTADAFSDLVLALSCFVISWRAWPLRSGIALATFSIGVAAVCGVFRFNGVQAALGPHEFFSLIATVAGVPLLAAALYWPASLAAQHPRAGALSLIFGGGIGLVLVAALKFALWAQLIPALAIVLILLTVWRSGTVLTRVGAALLLAAFVALATQWSVAGFSTVQCLHYLMAAGLLLLTWQPPAQTPAAASVASQ